MSEKKTDPAEKQGLLFGLGSATPTKLNWCWVFNVTREGQEQTEEWPVVSTDNELSAKIMLGRALGLRGSDGQVSSQLSTMDITIEVLRKEKTDAPILTEAELGH